MRDFHGEGFGPRHPEREKFVEGLHQGISPADPVETAACAEDPAIDAYGDPFQALLEDITREPLRRDDFLVAPPVRQVRHDKGKGLRAAEVDRVCGNQYGDLGGRLIAEHDLRLQTAGTCLMDESVPYRAIGCLHKIMKGPADDVPKGTSRSFARIAGWRRGWCRPSGA